MNTLKVLDVTLRDGGCVNNFNFGKTNIEKILKAQETAGIDIIELGYIDEINGTVSGRTQYINEQVVTQCILKDKKKGTDYVVMMDFGKFDVEKLKPRSQNGIDGIRIAFHKKNRVDIIKVGKKIVELGYDLYIQPMLTLRYTDAELIELIKLVNVELPMVAGFYIVDSFGEMRSNDMKRIINLIDSNLNASVTLGFHAHNNLQMAYSNAITLMEFSFNRNIIIDSSIMGMGKGAGNLNTELLLEHLNLNYGKNYYIEPLLEVIDKIINKIHSEFYWGYAVEYYLSSINHCTPSYASYFYGKNMLSIEQLNELLGMINEEKKISFDKEYAELLYRYFNERKIVDDSTVVNELKTEFNNKRILLIAPGKKIKYEMDKIKKIICDKEILSIGLNTILDIELDYILVTRKEIYNQIKNDKKIIVSSNVSKEETDNIKVLNYANWIEIDKQTYDSSSVIAFKLLQVCNVKEILLAGFDGFSVDINENYFDSNMCYPIKRERVYELNRYYKEMIKKIRSKGINIIFVTESLYE